MSNDLLSELQEKLEYWQKVLRLQDWDIVLQIKRFREMSDSETQGEVNYLLPKKMAIISLINLVDYPDDTPWKFDMEQTLIHELLHLHAAPFSKFTDDSPEDVALEQMIDLTSSALVRLKRGET